MGTRSTISILREDETVATIYCHWDGYEEHNGKLLLEHWNTPEKIEELIALGDLSSLGKVIGTKHPFSPDYNAKDGVDTWNKLYRDMCNAYGRDRDEKNTAARVYRNLQHYENSCPFEEYNYVFMHGTWTYAGPNTGPRVLKLK